MVGGRWRDLHNNCNHNSRRVDRLSYSRVDRLPVPRAPRFRFTLMKGFVVVRGKEELLANAAVAGGGVRINVVGI